MKDYSLGGQRGDTAARRTSQSCVIRGGTIQSDTALTLEPRPPTERPWQAVLRLLARRTGWTANQSAQSLLLGSGIFSHVSMPRAEPCGSGPLKMQRAGTESEGGSQNQGEILPKEGSLKQQKISFLQKEHKEHGSLAVVIVLFLFLSVFAIIC